jgi:hypothetical protein
MRARGRKFGVKTRPQIFLAQNSTFFNGFPLSSMAFQFSSMAFHFPRNPGKSIYGGKYMKDCYPSFVFQPKSRYSVIK